MMPYSLLETIRRGRRDADAGFALPLSLGVGTIAILFAAIAINSSQTDRSIAVSRERVDLALTTAEIGVTRTQLFLDRYRWLATKNIGDWSQAVKTRTPSQLTCQQADNGQLITQIDKFDRRDWQNIDDTNPNKGRYKVVDYRYVDGVGKLSITGEIDGNIKGNKSLSNLTINIPIGSEAGNLNPPALWANNLNLNNEPQINGNIRVNVCALPSESDLDGITGAIDSNITHIDGKPSGRLSGDIFTTLPAIFPAPNNAIDLPAITTSITLPRSSDLPDERGNYNYRVGVESATSNYSIRFQDRDRLTININPDRQVNLYLQGNIEFANSQTVNVNPIQPNLRIYGSDRTAELGIANSAIITALIHAPAAKAIVRQGNTAASNGITGAVWVDRWDTQTNNAAMVINQAGTWTGFNINSAAQPALINPPRSWQQTGNTPSPSPTSSPSPSPSSSPKPKK
jgi:hypothetical protein